MLERLTEVIETLMGYGATADKAVEVAARIVRDEQWQKREEEYDAEQKKEAVEGDTDAI